jgi:hypothetical protein
MLHGTDVRPERLMNATERRAVKRFEVDWTIKIAPLDSKAGEWEETGSLKDISSAGAYGIFAIPIEAGLRVKVMIQLPLWRGEWISYTARILRAEVLDSTSGIAFAFDEVRPAFAGGCQ